jgi:hypothetical protein
VQLRMPDSCLRVLLRASSGDLKLVLTDETDCDGIGLTKITGGCFNLEAAKHFDSAYIA